MLIDTHKSVKDLTSAGMPTRQAEALVSVLSATMEQLATKDDLSSSMNSTESTLRQEIELLRRDLTIKIYAVGTTLAALVVGFGVWG